MSHGAIYTITHDGQTSNFYRDNSSIYEVPHTVLQANKLASEFDLDIHDAYVHMGKDYKYLDPDMASPDQMLFEKLSDNVLDVILKGFRKSNAILQHITIDFDNGTIDYKNNELCFSKNCPEDVHEDLPELLYLDQTQRHKQSMSM